MKRILIASSVFVLLFSTSFTPPKKEKADGKINWLTFEEAVKKLEDEPRKIIIDVYTDWCGWCKKMDKTTFQDPLIVDYINQNYYAVKFNAEQKEDVQFDGQTFKFVGQGRRGYHELAAAMLQGEMSYPSMVFLDEEANMIQPIPGFQQPQQLHPILKFLVEGLKEKQTWENFMASYKTPY